MAYFIGISAILLLFFGVAVEGVKLGANCTVTANCTSTVLNSDCTGTAPKKCTCVYGYVAKSDNTKCLVKFNGTCDNTARECLPNATCTNTLCMCNTYFRPSDNGTECHDILINVLRNVQNAGVNCSNLMKSGATSMTVSVVLMMAAILVSLTQFTDSFERNVVSHERQIQ
ncbi:prion-like-(Q/N-rich) domain-bearing protein 25 isoform X2 [Littorina saxatilis]|uniref:prion-like-(Q/N-rich) domain-bearing protein 25 isoform X2 n=1 Tax=Littorina saxatilis TaxID=31220 RepID=UPI0038B5A8EA